MKVTLPSGRRVVAEDPLDEGALALADWNVLRAIRTKLGLLEEEEIEIACRNCDAPIRCKPCSLLATGPFEDGELDDPELDATLPFDVPHAIPRVRLVGERGVTKGATRSATTATLTARTVAEAAPLREALARRRFVVTPAVVRAMGLAALGDETRPDRIARALETASDAAWSAVTGLFLGAHYPPRLFSVVACPACGARNDVDAPYDREFEPNFDEVPPAETSASNMEPLPSFDDFSRAARDVADRELRARNAGGVAFVVEGGVAACDDGGEPLLGAYVPADPGGPAHPSKDAEITVFYRTFAAMWREDGPYDWRAELEETVRHELDHHFAALAGGDPVDDEERAEIAREAARIHGKSALARGAASELGRDIAAFVRRTWPIWLLLAIATIAATWLDMYAD
jgi:hypothetical protein